MTIRMKAITPVISIIILLLITVALAGASWTFISGYWSGMTDKQIEVVDSFCIATGEGKILIKNIGSSPMTTDEITVMDRKTGTDLADEVSWSSDVAESGLVLELKFDDGTGTAAKDTSGNNNNGVFVGETFYDGTIINETAVVDGKFGKALSFDGVDERVYLGQSFATLAILDRDFTLEAWANAKDFEYSMDIILGGSGYNNGIMSSGNGYRFVLWNTSNDLFSINMPAITGVYYHVAGVFHSSTGLMELYLNGEPAGTTSLNGNMRNTAIEIGGTAGWGGTFAIFNGTIDEARIYNRSLTQEEIKEDMKSAFPTNRTLASYRFDDVSGTTAPDSHIWVKGNNGAATSFDGVDDYVITNNDIPIKGKEDRTVAGWVKSDTTDYSAGDGYFFSFGIGGLNVHYGLAARGNPATWQLTDGSSWYDTTISVSTSNSQHIAVTHDDDTNNSLVYIDGQLVQTQQLTSLNTGNGANTVFNLGRYLGNSGFFNGMIDAVRVYNRVLDDTEIRATATNSVLISPGKTSTFTHTCDVGNRCDYRLLIGSVSRTATVVC